MSTAIRLRRRKTDVPRMIIPFRSTPTAFDQTHYEADDSDDTHVPDGTLTLPQFWHTRLKPDRTANLSPRTISSDLDALSAWKQFTDDIDLLSLRWRSKDDRLNSLRTLRAQLQKFVRVQLQKGISGTSINTRLRHIRSMLRMASDPIEHGIIDHVPDLGRSFTGTKSAWQIKATRRKPRETVTAEEMERLFHSTAAADNPHLWKVIILLLWIFFGAGLIVGREVWKPRPRYWYAVKRGPNHWWNGESSEDGWPGLEEFGSSVWFDKPEHAVQALEESGVLIDAHDLKLVRCSVHPGTNHYRMERVSWPR